MTIDEFESIFLAKFEEKVAAWGEDYGSIGVSVSFVLITIIPLDSHKARGQCMLYTKGGSVRECGMLWFADYFRKPLLLAKRGLAEIFEHDPKLHTSMASFFEMDHDNFRRWVTE